MSAAEVKIETASGVVCGREAGGVRAFLGIPYARAPAGALRFRPPQPAPSWAGVREAFAFGAPAPQNPGMVARLLGLRAEAVSEDCLSLNVWAPPAALAPRPVLVWIHGGSFTSGTGGSPVYAGDRLAASGDVVVVTLNYRLGALGFLAIEGEADSEGGCGNRGMLDQIAALEWVRENIAAFGGDPGRVTVFGESAGAMSVMTLMAVPRARGLFQRALAQSGGAENASSREQAERVTACFLDELSLSRDPLHELDAVPVPALLAAQERAQARVWRELSGLTFQPVVDGIVLPERPLEAFAAGRTEPLPLLLGTNRDEVRLWGPTDPKAASLDEPALLRRLRRTIPGAGEPGAELAEQALALYREAWTGEAERSPTDLWFAMETDRLVRAPTRRVADRHHPRQPDTWAYLFTWCSPALGGALGSCHALEIPFVFGTLDVPGVSEFTGGGEAADRLSVRMQEAWRSFACGGGPCDEGVAWDAYRAPGRATRLLDRQCKTLPAPEETELAFWDRLVG